MGVQPPQPVPPVDGLELVKNAYIRQRDVMFEWHKSLNPWHANAVIALVNQSALYAPQHPLRKPGETGLTIHVAFGNAYGWEPGYDTSNRPHLLFSLAQVQYLQYYIHTMRLTTPVWVEYHQRRAELIAEVAEEEVKMKAQAQAGATEGLGEGVGAEAVEGGKGGKEERDGKTAKQRLAELKEPSHDEGKDDWVPLPNMFLRADLFTKIETITVPSHFIMSKVTRQIEKDSKLAEKLERAGLPPPEFSEARFEAIVDNFTEGPGLRKGPARNGRRGREGRGEGRDGADGMGEEDMKAGLESNATPTPLTSDPPAPSTTSPPTPAEPDTPATPSSPPPPSVDLGMRYFFFCQQALIVAAEGGFLNASGPRQPKPSTPEEDADEEDYGADSQLPPEVGRSLFVSLTATRWEQNPNVILEVGWSAVYWRDKVEGETVIDEDGVEREEEGRFVEARDWGHWVIQDHILTKKNGETKPDYRDSYLFGDTLPFESAKLKNALKAKLQELNKRAGNGPIYILTHTPAGEEVHLKDIGLDIHTRDPEIQLDTWQVPPYQCVSGCQSVLLINTAALFGAIEGAPTTGVPTILQQVGRTRKSLQHVMLQMFGQEPGRRPEKCGNAGNDAFYTLQMFLALMLGPPLPDLRVDYQQSLLEPSAPDAVDADTCTKMVEAVPLVGSLGSPSVDAEDHEKGKREGSEVQLPGEQRGERKGNPKAEGEDEGDEEGEEYYEDEEDERKFIDDPNYLEDDEIIGVCYEDEEGNLIDL